MDIPDPAAARKKLTEALKAWNAGPEPDRRAVQAEAKAIIAEVEAEDAAAAAAEAASVMATIDGIGRRLDKLIEQGRPPPPRRSVMSAAEKARAIERMGIDAYNQLPW